MSTIRIFRHYVKLPIVLLGLMEALICFAAVYAATYLRSGSAEWLGLDAVLPKAAIFAFMMTAGMLSTGLYRSGVAYSVRDLILRLIVGIVMGVGALAMVFYLFPSLFIGRGVITVAASLSFLAVASLRGIFFHLVDQDKLKRSILVLGAGKKARAIAELERHTPHSGFRVVGYVKADGDGDASGIARAMTLSEGLVEFALERRIEEIVVALDERRRQFPMDELLECKLQGINIVDEMTFFERETGRVPLELLHPSWLVFSDGWRVGTVQKAGRRLFDIAVSLSFLLFTFPVMVVTALAILIESRGRGPIFYRQTRVGYNGKPFRVIKFRSMIVDAERDGEARWAVENDDRVTRVGAMIRKYRVDELPQIFNVLRGQMSFVGPRPERPEFVAELAKTIPFYAERHRVKPGITGWAQLRYRYGASAEDAAEKLQYDLYYVKNRSLFLDALILLQTAEVILWCRGSR